MKNIVLKFGLIAGILIAAFAAILMPLCMRGTIDWAYAEILGYSAMILAFVMVFFGIRAYRDDVEGGSIGFGRAFRVGILITLVASAIYVVSWQIVYYGFLPNFAETYSEFHLDKMRDEGASAEVLEAERVKMERFQELYANPFFNIAVTFMEVFPVGLIVTLVSAAILRRKPEPPLPAAQGVA